MTSAKCTTKHIPNRGLKMLTAKVQGALNDQLNYELVSSYLYMSMAAYFESKNLPGMSNWMRIQIQEELQHVSKFFDYIHERDARVILNDVETLKMQSLTVIMLPALSFSGL